jgi:hypothetical protein
MAAQREVTRSSYVPQDYAALLKFCENLHAAAISYKDRWTQGWSRNAEIYRGNNWDTKKEGNPFFKTNLARAKLDRKAAMMTAAKPEMNVLPLRNGLAQTAELLQRTIHAGWDAWNVQMKLEQLSAFVRPFGCAFFKIVWDRSALHGLGDIAIGEIDPRAIALDPYTLRAYGIDKSLVIIHESVVPFSWVAENFPRTYRDVQDFSAPPPSLPEQEASQGRRWSSRTIRSPLNYYLAGMRGGSGEPGAVSPIPYVRFREFWFADPAHQDGEPLYPDGRVLYIVGSGNKATIMNPAPEESRNPYFDGLWAFEMYDNRPDIDSPWGSSEVEDVRRLEEALNRAGHMMMRYLVKNIPFVVADTGALPPQVLERLKDFGDAIISKMRGLEVSRIPAENPVQVGIAFINLVQQLMDSAIGIGDSPIRGQGRAEVRSLSLLFGLEQSSHPLVNAQARRLESFLERVFTKVISRIFQFYRADRFIPYIGNDGRATSFHFEAEKLRGEIRKAAIESVAARLKDDREANMRTIRVAIEQALRGAWREFKFKIAPLSSLSAAREARGRTLAQLAELGWIPSRLVLEEAGFSNWQDLAKEAAEEAMMRQQLGLLPPPGAQKSKKK